MKNKASLLLLCFIMVCLVWIPFNTHAGKRKSPPLGVNFFSSAVISDSRYLVAGDLGKIFLSKDSGKTWENIESNKKNALVSVCFPDEQHGWITGQGGVVLHSKDAGESWTAQSSGTEKYLLAVDFFDKQTGIAVGADSAVIITKDGGSTWHKSSFTASADVMEDPDIAEEFNLFTVKMMDAENACIAGDGGRIFITKDSGQSWIDVKSPLYDADMMEGKILYSLSYDDGTLYAAGIDGVLITSHDGGQTWAESDTGFSEPELFCLDMVGRVGLAAGSGGHLISTNDGGATWKIVSVPEKVTWRWLSGVDLKKSSNGNVNGLIVGQNGGVGHFQSGKITWLQEFK